MAMWYLVRRRIYVYVPYRTVPSFLLHSVQYVGVYYRLLSNRLTSITLACTHRANSEHMSFSLKTTSTSKLVGGVLVRDHIFSMPLDWKEPDNPEKINVFVRELSKGGGSDCAATGPAVMYLQGGPGFPSPRPTGPPSGWMKSALDKGLRVLLLDQRGTGNSTAVTPQLLDKLHSRAGIELQAEYLYNMRSDAIAQDIEAIRSTLCGNSSPVSEDQKLTLLGQSFGGFCMLSALSFHPEGVGRCIFTCGLAPVTRSIREVYIATYRRMLTRNRRFYSRYPADKCKVKEIIRFLHSQTTPVVLPNGGHLTVRRFLQLGLMLGSAAGMETMHWLLENPFFEQPSSTSAAGASSSSSSGSSSSSSSGGVLSEAFLYAIQEQQACFETNPLYWFLHESIYMNGDGTASNWTAESVILSDEFKNVFDPILALQDEKAHINFTGEMVMQWMAEDYAKLRPYAELANLVAKKEWDRPLYDLETLKNKADIIPCAALVSYDDVYVEREFSEETANLLSGEDSTCQLWISNEFQHSGLRDEPARVFDTLFAMTNGELSLPS